MSVRIGVSKNNYLHCDVEIDVETFKDYYNSPEEYIEDMLEEIIQDCKKRDYTLAEVETVISYYTTTINNSPVVWEDKN